MFEPETMLLREAIGETIRDLRLNEDRTLRQVSSAAQVSLGYLSEIERGQKEASSEVIASIAAALGMTVGELMTEVATRLMAYESDQLVALPLQWAA
ncbi:MAG: helix-turn-helix domain-containing protein [Propionibacteriaceae bacterium]|jgi:transcriptional regulator with XRE-family HTH domain|nr:helix-turn-helix domain-containing protein [Propionibacteriaceae bacterium]